MKIVLLQTGKTTERYLAEGLTNYEERIRRYSSFETITLPDIKKTRNMPEDEQKAKEGAQMLRIFREDDFIVILDDKGREFSTTEFSSWLEKSLMIQKKRILFVIGGPWGFAYEIRRKADMTLSLSRMTFSHQMVRLLFLEQLYRAFTVIRGEPYHHE
ncbi:MAG TPA: 23S rRNA (pseudouridine(1915)-N(3))-methyltransferase RlmH [Bacteroidales bacterium]|nr:23S rRNA (pseudouridine(1915)-N(3))-methyltransferase RlmH [Bacteroidales bacterium]